MEFNWDDFKSSYSNEQEARQGFAMLCEAIMKKHYPDFIAKNSDTIIEKQNTEDKTLDRKCIIYLPKYFLDGVSNSRKGQIRKALNDNLPYMKANKIEQWVLMMPLEFSPEEKNWWENWSLRIKQENAITPTAILSKEIVALIAKYGIEFKGVEKIIQEASDGTVDFVFEDEPVTTEPVAAAPSPTETAEPVAVEVAAEPVSTTVTETKVVEHTVEPTVETVDVVVNDDTTTTTTTTTQTTTRVTTVTTTEQPTALPTSEPKVVRVADPTVTEAPKPDPKLLSAADIAARQMSETVKADDGNKTIALTISDSEPEEETIEESKSESKSSDPKKVREPNLNQLKLTYHFKQDFEDLETQKLNLPTDGYRNGQRGVFDRRRDLSNVKNYLNDFVFGDLSNFKGKELVKKAQIYVTNEQYSRGLYIYEYAYAKKLVEKDIMDDYKKGVAEAEFKLNYKYHMIDGDLKFAKGDYINAADAYERAINTKNAFTDKLEETMSYSMEAETYSPSIRDTEAETKNLEAKAEALLHINEYAEAVENFKSAIDLDPENKELAQRYELAQKLLRWQNIYNNKWTGWLSCLWAPFHFYFNIRNKKEIKDLSIYQTIKRKAWIGLIVWGLLIALALALFFMRGRTGVCTDDISGNNTTLNTANAPATPLELCLQKGDYYMSMFSDDKPHYIDSAIYAYHRALRFDNTDTIAKPLYNSAMIRKANYIKEIQSNIDRDSATYFLSMRRPTEGLWLFKYKYDPSDPQKGKFGFVDTLRRIVIPPFYDFNYKTMDEAGETFYNGKAKVCLEVAPYDTIYFYIDQRGNKIENDTLYNSR